MYDIHFSATFHSIVAHNEQLNIVCNNISISAVLINSQSVPNKSLHGPETETRGFQEQDLDQDYEVQDQDRDFKTYETNTGKSMTEMDCDEQKSQQEENPFTYSIYFSAAFYNLHN